MDLYSQKAAQYAALQIRRTNVTQNIDTFQHCDHNSSINTTAESDSVQACVMCQNMRQRGLHLKLSIALSFRTSDKTFFGERLSL